MTWDWWTHFLLAALMSAAITVNFLGVRRARRLQRQLQAQRVEVVAQFDSATAMFNHANTALRRAQTKLREATEVNQQVHELANLLAELCVQACGRDTVPVWRAWADTMGSLRVQIQGQRGTWIREIGEHAGEG